MNDASKKILDIVTQKTKRYKALLNFLLIFVMLFTLSACNISLYEGLTEKQANTMLVTLLKNDISAEKVSRGKNGFAIMVDESKLVQSLDILNTQNLPGEDFQNLGTIFKGDSMIASPGEESARMAYAISQELSDTFSRMDGVLTSRVHIVLGAADQVSGIVTDPSAAIFIRHMPESTIVNYVAQLRDMTAKAIPNLIAKNVSVVLMPMRESISTPRVIPPTFFGVFTRAMNDSPLIIVLLLITTLGIIAYFIPYGISFVRKYQKKGKTSDTSDANKGNY